MPKASRASKVSRVARRNDPLNTLTGSIGVVRTAAVTDAAVVTPVEGQPIEHFEKKASRIGTFVDEDGPESQTLSRGQRKRHARREQYLKKEKLILSSLTLQKREEQKRRIDGLDAIKQALLSTTTTTASSTKGKEFSATKLSSVSTNKAKRKMMAVEMEHMHLILQHPAYKADPFETMQVHLRNTFEEDRKQQEQLAEQRAETEKQKAAEKQKLKKERLESVKKRSRKMYKPRRTK
jgi:hypothetical protein